MKPFLVLFLLASPLVLALNATEKAPTTVKSPSETNLESADHSPAAPVTTDSTAAPIKNNNVHQAEDAATTAAAPKEEKKLDPKFLHRIPVFRDRNPLVETIKKLESDFQGLNNKKTEEANSTTELELPIPSRCPHITGTAEEDVKAEHKADWVPLLGASSKSKAAQRGCRFFIMNELMERSTVVFAHSTPEAQLNRTLNSCFHSCVQAYDNGTDVCNACFDGCRKTAAVTEAVKKAMPAHEGDELEREDGAEHSPDMHRTFSIIIPLRTLPEIEGNEQNGVAQNEEGGAFPSMMPNAIRMMLQMMHQMTERARQAMIQQQQGGQSPMVTGNGGSNIQESELSIDPSGSISVSRSMSVLMTKDKDGHSKMVVVHTLPKIQVHRFGQGGGLFGADDEERFHGLADGKEHTEGDEDDDELMEDGDDLRVRLFGHMSKTNGHNHQAKDTLDEKELGSSTQVYFYRSRLCYYLPRLFYLTLIILILYVVFWLFCAVPTALYGRNSANRRNSLDSNVSMISAGAEGDAKRKKFYFTKNAKYFQLNNKRNSTVSLPPPYPGAEEAAESLPEKQPLPEGGLEIKLDSDKK